jgi:hypothetical protein
VRKHVFIALLANRQHLPLAPALILKDLLGSFTQILGSGSAFSF